MKGRVLMNGEEKRTANGPLTRLIADGPAVTHRKRRRETLMPDQWPDESPGTGKLIQTETETASPVALGTPVPLAKVLSAGASRLDAIARGEPFESEIHAEFAQETPILEIDHFSLSYGPKQVLFNISMIIPRGKVTAIIGPAAVENRRSFAVLTE